LELGVSHWDTANSYNAGSGNSERLLGRYFASRDKKVRNEVVLSTKVKNSVRDEHKMKQDFSPNEMGSSRKYIIRAVEDSLKRLQTDWIDILYHHFPDKLPDGTWETPLEETWDAFNQLVHQGKVRYLAVSNRTITQLEQEINALKAVTSNISRRIIGVQNAYNILQPYKLASLNKLTTKSDEKAFLDYIEKKQIGLVPYIPLAVGLLTGRYRKDDLDTSGRLSDQAEGEWRHEFLTSRNLDVVEKLILFAKNKGCSLAQLAIAWLLSHDVVCSVIAGITKLDQLKDNVGAVSVSLTKKDLTELDRITS
jgi:aryl-alcohol dehydrogenase-like predicted oxidoreductase